ncbi:MAG: DEDD exonuclease domain-containing protein [Kineosporiaceae bacterium]
MSSTTTPRRMSPGARIGRDVPPRPGPAGPCQGALDLVWPGPVAADHPCWHSPGSLPLAEATFCVVDLETTGASPDSDAVTEVGAVKVRGGEVVGELASLVDPGRPVPAAVTALTGITSTLLAGAPRMGSVLPAFLEFAAGTVLVAHNAAFDVSFLRAACTRAGTPWPAPPVVDTLRLARAVLDRDEAPDHRLATLARVLGARTAPRHRALDDARATVDVLHALIAWLPAAVTVDDLRAACRGAAPAQARRRHLARDVPHGPGVYRFVDAGGRVLYVGSAGDLRTRVRTYFTRGERRHRMTEMVGIAAAVTTVACPTVLEARVREVRLIAAERPPYNRRSRAPDRARALVLTDEAVPRAALVRRPGTRQVLALFPGAAAARAALAALHELTALRRCTDRLRRAGGGVGNACVLGQIGRCPAPCETGASAGYDTVVAAARAELRDDPGPLAARARVRMAALAATERFEAAGGLRDGLGALLRGVERARWAASLERAGELLAARRIGAGPGAGGWEGVHVVGGRLAGTARSASGRHPGPVLDALVTTSGAPAGPPSLEETSLVWQWLCGDGVRLVRAGGGWWLPVSPVPPPTG